jgi:hypothetical protein
MRAVQKDVQLLNVQAMTYVGVQGCPLIRVQWFSQLDGIHQQKDAK